MHFNDSYFKIMSILNQRAAHEERNKYYTMIGALAAKRTGGKDAIGEGLAGLR